MKQFEFTYDPKIPEGAPTIDRPVEIKEIDMRLFPGGIKLIKELKMPIDPKDIKPTVLFGHLAGNITVGQRVEFKKRPTDHNPQMTSVVEKIIVVGEGNERHFVIVTQYSAYALEVIGEMSPSIPQNGDYRNAPVITVVQMRRRVIGTLNPETHA